MARAEGRPRVFKESGLADENLAQSSHCLQGPQGLPCWWGGRRDEKVERKGLSLFPGHRTPAPDSASGPGLAGVSRTPLGWRLSSSARGALLPGKAGQPGRRWPGPPPDRAAWPLGRPGGPSPTHFSQQEFSRNPGEYNAPHQGEGLGNPGHTFIKFRANIGRRTALHLSRTYLPRDPSWGEAPSG